MQLTGEKTYLTWAMEAGDCLLRSATVYEYGIGWVRESLGVALTGFAHGTAGIMLALARLGCEAQEEKKAALMRSGVIEAVCHEGADVREILELQECGNYGLFGGIAGIGYSGLCEPGKGLELLRME